MGHKKKNLIDPQSLNMPYGGVDSHAHLSFDRLWEDRDAILERAKACGVSHIGQVFLRHADYQEKKDYFLTKEGIFFIYGLHPTDLLNLEEDEFEKIKADILVDQEQGQHIRAIGEIGLDFYWKEVPHLEQEVYFRKQLRFANEIGLPVAIHSREAFDDTMRILLDEGYSQKKLLWHCFDKSKEHAEIIMEHGWYLSIPGQISYKGNDFITEALSAIDLNRLLVETDSPFLSPEPWRGKTNEPALCVFTAEIIANALGRSKEELWLQCGENARRFFNI